MSATTHGLAYKMSDETLLTGLGRIPQCAQQSGAQAHLSAGH